MNWEKRFDNPTVKTPSLPDVMPTPILELKSRRKSVEATLRVKQAMMRLVWVFLRRRSFTGKYVSYILTRQCSVLQAKRTIRELHNPLIMSGNNDGFTLLLKHMKDVDDFLSVNGI